MRVRHWAVGLMAIVSGAGVGSAHALSTEAAAAQLLALHRQVIQAHLDGNAEALLERESEEYVSGNRGEISFPTLAERRSRMSAYLGTTTFHEYRDLVEPVVQVSPDGRLGWVMAQVAAKGTQRAADGTVEEVEFVCAWIELYEHREGRWYRVGNLSNFKP